MFKIYNIVSVTLTGLNGIFSKHNYLLTGAKVGGRTLFSELPHPYSVTLRIILVASLILMRFYNWWCRAQVSLSKFMFVQLSLHSVTFAYQNKFPCQGSKGIRQWPISWFTSQMIEKKKYPFCRLKLVRWKAWTLN